MDDRGRSYTLCNHQALGGFLDYLLPAFAQRCGGAMGVFASFLLFWIGEKVFHLDRPTIQTLIFLKLAVAGHMTIYLARTGEKPFWTRPFPAAALFVTTESTQLIGTLVAVYGIFMNPIGWKLAGLKQGGQRFYEDRVSLTHGYTTMSMLVEKLWTTLHNIKPSIVGGCRQLELQQYIRAPEWRIKHINRIARLGIASEILIAKKVSTAGEDHSEQAD